MKRIILDHIRRWWWVWALAAIVQSTVCWFSSTNTPPPKDFFISMFAIFVGPFLLQFDLQRGFARTLVVLPLTTRQIGRTWWLATVGLPALALSLLSFLSAGISHLLHPAGNFQTEWLAMNSIVSLLFLGTSFSLLLGFSNTSGGSWWEKIRNTICGALWGGIIGGWMLISNFVFDSPQKTMWALGIGTLLTVIGWFCAENLILIRTGFRRASQRSKNSPLRYNVPAGFGGLPYLFQNLVVRLAGIGILFAGIMIVIKLFMGSNSHLSSKQWIEALTIPLNIFSFFFIFMFVLLPIIMQLRLMRTLPISLNVLAATLVFLPVVLIISLGLIIGALIGITSEGLTGIFIPQTYLIGSGLMAICVPFFVWRGLATGTYLVLFTIVFSSSMFTIFFHTGRISSWVIVPIAILMTGFGFVLTRKLLVHNSEAYRVRTMPNNAWGMNR